MQCRYSRQQALKRKVWCKLLARHICILLATHPKFQAVPTSPRYSIQDVPKSRSFIITMTELRVEDSGFYWCGIDPSSNIIVLRSIHLVVSQGEFFPFCVCFSDSLNPKMLELGKTLKVFSFNSLKAEHLGSLPKVTNWVRAELAPELSLAGFRSVLPSPSHTFLCTLLLICNDCQASPGLNKTGLSVHSRTSLPLTLIPNLLSKGCARDRSQVAGAQEM